MTGLQWKAEAASEPLVAGASQTIVVTGTNPDPGGPPLALTRIDFELPAGPNASDLITPGTASRIRMQTPAGWKAVSKGGGVFSATPEHPPFHLSGDGFEFTFAEVPVNDQSGKTGIIITDGMGDPTVDLYKWPARFHVGDLQANPANPSGYPASTTLSWSGSAHAVYHLEYPGTDPVLVGPDGPKTIDGLTEGTPFTLRVTTTVGGDPVQVERQVYVSVQVPEPTIMSFQASGDDVISGQPLTLSWQVENMSSLLLEPTVGDVTRQTNVVVRPDQANLYILTAEVLKGYSGPPATKSLPVGILSGSVIDVGTAPTSITEGFDGSLFVTNSGSGTVSIIDPRARKITSTTAVGGTPVRAGGTQQLLFVLFEDGTLGVNGGKPIDAVVGRGYGLLFPNIQEPSPASLSDPSNAQAGAEFKSSSTEEQTTVNFFVADLDQNTVVSVRYLQTTRRTVTSSGTSESSTVELGPEFSRQVGEGPAGLAQPKAGGRMFVCCSRSGTVSVLDLLHGGGGSTIALPDSTSAPYGAALAPGGDTLYVALSGSDALAVFSALPSHELKGSVGVGSTPRAVAVSPDGTKVYVANSGSDTVTVVDAATLNPIASWAVGKSPTDLITTPDGTLWVVNNGDNTVSAIAPAPATRPQL